MFEMSIIIKLDQYDIFLEQSFFFTFLTRLSIDYINLLIQLGFKFNDDFDEIESII